MKDVKPIWIILACRTCGLDLATCGSDVKKDHVCKKAVESKMAELEAWWKTKHAAYVERAEKQASSYRRTISELHKTLRGNDIEVDSD